MVILATVFEFSRTLYLLNLNFPHFSELCNFNFPRTFFDFFAIFDFPHFWLFRQFQLESTALLYLCNFGFPHFLLFLSISTWIYRTFIFVEYQFTALFTLLQFLFSPHFFDICAISNFRIFCNFKLNFPHFYTFFNILIWIDLWTKNWILE